MGHAPGTSTLSQNSELKILSIESTFIWSTLFGAIGFQRLRDTRLLRGRSVQTWAASTVLLVLDAPLVTAWLFPAFLVTPAGRYVTLIVHCLEHPGLPWTTMDIQGRGLYNLWVFELTTNNHTGFERLWPRSRQCLLR